MKTKQIPAIVMLLGGAVACVVTYINHYDLKTMLVVLVLALIVFLIFGLVIKMIFDSFKMPEEAPVDGDGEVVEKQGEALEDESLDLQDAENNNEDQFEAM